MLAFSLWLGYYGIDPQALTCTEMKNSVHTICTDFHISALCVTLVHCPIGMRLGLEVVKSSQD